MKTAGGGLYLSLFVYCQVYDKKVQRTFFIAC